MKNINRWLLLLAALPLTGLMVACGSSDDYKGEPPHPAETYQPGTHPRFDPVARDLPFNTDLIFAAAADTDGTADVGDPSDPVRAALNQLDGFSTTGFFDVLISGSVNPATVVALQTVFLVEVDTGGEDALDPANIEGLIGPAAFSVQVISLDGGTNNVIRLVPTEPLKPKTKYLVFLTNDIQDAAGQPLTPSWTYNALRDTSFTVLEALAPVRTLLQGWELLASGFLAAVSGNSLSPDQAQEKLVLTNTFTTTDPHATLMAMAAPRAAIAALLIDQGVPAESAVSTAVVLDNNQLLPTPKARDLDISALTGLDFNAFSAQLLADVGTLYTGYIKLPYYQTAPDEDSTFGGFLTRNWQPSEPLANALGVSLPTDADGESYNVTYRFPFAAHTGEESVPLQLTLPDASWVPGYGGAANCGAIYGATGYPVVIYVHGITSDRTSVLALGHTLASQCIATVAIDLPVHGVPANSAFVNVLNVERSSIPFGALYGDNAPRERHFNVAGSGGAPAPMNFDEPGVTDGSGAQFINLGYLANTRDNMRQAVMDLLNLNASLGALNGVILGWEDGDGLGLDLNRVSLVGMSLGGILGTTFVTVNQQAIANDDQVELDSNLNPVRGLVASAAGSQVSQILVNSQTFGPVINAGLQAAGVNPGTSNFERFIYTAQSMVDSGDPVNFAALLSTQGVPVLIQQINADAVIPSYIEHAPLAGTEGLSALLGADHLGLETAQLGRGVVKLNAGGHASLLRPEGDAPQVTAELQTQVVSFVLGNGNVQVGERAPGDIELPPTE